MLSCTIFSTVCHKIALLSLCVCLFCFLSHLLPLQPLTSGVSNHRLLVFEPGEDNEDEFKKIHEAYKNLVDYMLGSYMEDLKITPEEFEKSCSVASKKSLNQFHQSLFQQVWAADDFEIFKRMMTQKNLELQLQALEYLSRKRGSVPDCLEIAHRPTDEAEIDEMLKKAIEIADFETNASSEDKALKEKMIQEAQKEKELLEEAIKQSIQSPPTESPEEQLPSEAATPYQQQEANNSTQSSDDTTQETDEKQQAKESETHVQEPEETKTEKDTDELETCVQQETETGETKTENSAPISDSTREVSNLADQCSNGISEVSLTCASPGDTGPPVKVPEERPWSEGDSSAYTSVQVEVSPLELEKRQNYLRQQRDRILAMKKQERARRFSTSEEVTSQARPRSARAARQLLREEATPEADPQTLVFRKTLAAKLRSEVVDKVD